MYSRKVVKNPHKFQSSKVNVLAKSYLASITRGLYTQTPKRQTTTHVQNHWQHHAHPGQVFPRFHHLGIPKPSDIKFVSQVQFILAFIQAVPLAACFTFFRGRPGPRPLGRFFAGEVSGRTPCLASYAFNSSGAISLTLDSGSHVDSLRR